jgi:hypothetical protein
VKEVEEGRGRGMTIRRANQVKGKISDEESKEGNNVIEGIIDFSVIFYGLWASNTLE